MSKTSARAPFGEVTTSCMRSGAWNSPLTLTWDEATSTTPVNAYPEAACMDCAACCRAAELSEVPVVALGPWVAAPDTDAAEPPQAASDSDSMKVVPMRTQRVTSRHRVSLTGPPLRASSW